VPAVLQPRDPDSETPDLIDNTFAAQFDNNELQLARDPAKALRCSVSLSSDIVGYGESLAATIYLANVSDSNRLPAVFLLGPNGFLDPHVIVVASIAPADNPQDVQTAILSHRYLVSQRLLGPGQTNSVEEYLNIGPIRSILRDHPQRTYEVTFQAILDPVPDGQGGFRPRLPSIQPQPVVVTRTGFAPTRDRIRTQLLAARSGSTGERIHAVELLAGLVREADRARRSQLGYTPLPIDRDALVQAIAANLGHVEPRVRAWAAYALVSLGAPATPEQARGLSNCLNDENWFPRFLAVHCLAPITDLSEYLRWTAPTETDVLLRRQILLLQGKPWPTITLPEPGTSQAPATEQTASPPATSLGYSPTPVSPPITPDPALPTS